ncbi:hypothetical protein DEO72_LG2g4288 [Vigna unguiculata]|uniref:Uncharacterized protein n=1 Tax=Vigna unguiculata TaxID=3917 RepID=A0A4D6L609_VIGUN|nr:hypothetical protein DEO72_LG2g4288 [Vigna unguiculata]
MTSCQTYQPQPIEHVRETMLRIIHHNARWSSQIRTCTLTPATLANPSSTQGFLVFIRHPEHNSRDAIPSSTLGMLRAKPYPELNSRDTFRAQLKEPNNLTFEASPKAL